MKSDEFRYGISWLDEQNGELIKAFNAFHEACERARCTTDAPKVISRVSTLAPRFFRTEDTYMVRSGYSDYKRHQREHFSFVYTMRKYSSMLAEKEIDIETAESFLNRMARWIAVHIGKDDRDLADHLKASGIE